MKDYIPFMDKYPELNLRPVTEFPEHSKIRHCDYVQNLNLTGLKAPQGYFYLIVKNAKFGIYMFDRGLLSDTTSLVLPPQYEYIVFVKNRRRSCAVIVRKGGKYGMFFWTYSCFFNDTYVVSAEYDEIKEIEGGRYRAVKQNQVVYFDSTGHVLK